MPGFLKISEASSLAIHAMAYLKQQANSRTSTHEMAGTLKVSAAHLAKVLQRLEHAGLIQGKRGPRGGFVLKQKPEEITLLAIYEVIEGPHQPVLCLLGQPVCNRKCPLKEILHGVEAQVTEQLKRKTVADLEVEF